MRISRRAVVFIAIAGVAMLITHKHLESRKQFRHLTCRRLAMRRKIARRRAARTMHVTNHAAEIVENLRLLRRKFTAGDWTALLELGDAYRKGMYPWFRGNRERALDVYKIACGSPDPQVAGAAQLRYIECRVDTIAKEDVHGAELPGIFATRCIAHAKTIMKDTPAAAFRRPEVLHNVEDIQTIFHTIAEEPVVQNVPHIITSDTQNVHDHGLTASLRKFLDSSSSADAYDQVMEFVLESDLKHKEDAFRVLESLGSTHHSGLNVSERDALNAVWAKIDALPTDLQHNARETLVHQLASGVENEAIVCSTGKIARIVGAMDGISDTSLKPTWAVREEIGTLAAKIRNAGGDETQFRKDALDTYVKDLGMNHKVVAPIIEEYVLGFS